MTHDELLAKIDEHFEVINDCIGYSPRYGYQPSVDAIKSALRAVVELPDQRPPTIDPEEYDSGFRGGYNRALADMKQAIEKELK